MKKLVFSLFIICLLAILLFLSGCTLPKSKSEVEPTLEPLSTYKYKETK